MCVLNFQSDTPPVSEMLDDFIIKLLIIFPMLSYTVYGNQITTFIIVLYLKTQQ